jgi:hypothetical protein
MTHPPLFSANALIRDKETLEPAFVVQIYGVASLSYVGGPEGSGGQLVRRALRDAGLDPDDWYASLFDTWPQERPACLA